MQIEGKIVCFGTEGIDEENDGKPRTWNQSFENAKVTLTPEWAIIDGFPCGRPGADREIHCIPRERLTDLYIEPYDKHRTAFYENELVAAS